MLVTALVSCSLRFLVSLIKRFLQFQRFFFYFLFFLLIFICIYLLFHFQAFRFPICFDCTYGFLSLTGVDQEVLSVERIFEKSESVHMKYFPQKETVQTRFLIKSIYQRIENRGYGDYELNCRRFSIFSDKKRQKYS